MIPLSIRQLIRQKSRSIRRQPAELRRSRRYSPVPDFLELRITPTGNIVMTGASVVDSGGNPLTSINTGEGVFVKANFTTTNLPSGSSYTINFEVNGLTLTSSPITSGAGSSGTQSFTYSSSTDSESFTATPGSNQVIVTIDPTHSVVESSYSDNSTTTSFNASSSVVGGLSYTPAQMRQAYGIGLIPNVGSTVSDGTGQTIAIVDAYNDPTSVTDLDGFDQAMSLTVGSNESLYTQYGPASSFFNVFNQNGTNITANIGSSGTNGVPQVNAGWDGEITLDIEWAHSIAPGAKIDLVEANSASGDLYTADAEAAKLPGVSVVSNSWGGGEDTSDLSIDNSIYVTPAGHQGVTFLASTGDSGAPGGYPAYSPNVVAVGGTQLTLSSNGYGGESAWSYPTPSTLNNGSSSYSQTGTWSSVSGGFSGTYSTAAGGSSAAATWTTSNVGEQIVSATWTAASSNATNATYTIYDGSASSGVVLGTVKVDQTKAPVGITDGKFQFQELGDFTPSSGTLTVVLNASTANGKVVADAVGLSDLSAGGGGESLYEKEPSYQLSVQNTGFREIPDVSFDASVNSPVDFYENGQLDYGIAGTSLACPCWAGLIAIVNQDRVAEGGKTLDSTTNPIQTQQGLYSIPASDYNDVTTGFNGFSAGPGYDLATGIGSPIANLVVPALAAFENLNDLVVTSQPSGTIAAGSDFGFTVTVESSLGTPISTFNGPVTISLGNDPGNGVLGGTLTVNAVNGVATFSNLTLDNAGTGYTINVTGTKLTSATTSAFNVIAGLPSALVIESQPTSIVTAGSPFGLTLSIQDSYGNQVVSDSGTFTVSLGNNPGNTTLGGTLTVSAVNGVLTISGLTLDKADSGYTLIVSGGGLSGVTTSPITVNPAAAAQLTLLQGPSTTTIAGSYFGLELAIEDLYGNLETGVSTPVTASLQFGAGPLSGSSTVNSINGIASFVNLTDNQAVTIDLQFSSPGLNSVTSGNIVILPAAPTQLIVEDQPSTTAIAGEPFALQPLIYEEDQFGNLATNDNSSVITASLANGSGTLIGTTSLLVSDGVARYSNLADTKGETIALKFIRGTLQSLPSSNIVVTKLIPTMTVSTPATTATYKQAVTFNVSLTPVSGTATPTGTVSFLDGSTVLGTSTINLAGKASFTTTALPLGTQAITVKYSGDASNSTLTSTSSIFVGDLPNSDFSGDGKTDLAVFGFNPAYGKYGFTVVTSSSGFKTTTFFDNNGYGYGNAQSIPVVGDFFGDGQDAYALWTPNSLGGMTFTAISSLTGKSLSVNFGTTSDIPVVADIDGDGKDDFGIYGNLPGYGYSFDFLLSSANFASTSQSIFNNHGYGYGNAQSIPIVADFDGSGKAGFGVYNPSSSGSTFSFVDPSTNTSFTKTIPSSLSTVNDVPMAVSYSGSGTADLALYGPDPAHPGEYRYLVLTASSGFNPSAAVTFNNGGYGYGNSLSTPVMADYDGTGKDDFAVYTPDFTGGMEFVFQSNQTGAGQIGDFAATTELPVMASTYLLAKKVRGQ